MLLNKVEKCFEYIVVIMLFLWRRLYCKCKLWYCMIRETS